MPLDRDVDLGLGDTLLDGEPAPQIKDTAPNFWSMSIVAKRLDGSKCHLVCR